MGYSKQIRKINISTRGQRHTYISTDAAWMQKKPSSPGGGKEKIEHEGSEKELNSEDDLERKAKIQVS